MVNGNPLTPSPEREKGADNEGGADAPASGWVSNTPKGRALELINDGWNEICVPTGLPKTLPTPSLLAMVVRRLREHPELEWWQVVLEEIATNPFYHGRNNYRWDADFEWLVKNDRNAVKVWARAQKRRVTADPEEARDALS